VRALVDVRAVKRPDGVVDVLGERDGRKTQLEGPCARAVHRPVGRAPRPLAVHMAVGRERHPTTLNPAATLRLSGPSEPGDRVTP